MTFIIALLRVLFLQKANLLAGFPRQYGSNETVRYRDVNVGTVRIKRNHRCLKIVGCEVIDLAANATVFHELLLLKDAEFFLSCGGQQDRVSELFVF